MTAAIILATATTTSLTTTDYIYVGGAIFAFLLIIFLIIFLRRRIKKKKKQKTEIPEDILADFEEAEKRLRESNGETDPTLILWELMKEKSEKLKRLNAQTMKKEVGNKNGKKTIYNNNSFQATANTGRIAASAGYAGIAKPKFQIIKRKLPQQPSGRQDVQGVADSGDGQQYIRNPGQYSGTAGAGDTGEGAQPGTKPRGRFFFRRRKSIRGSEQ